MVDFYVTFDTAYTVAVSMSNLQVKPMPPYMLTISTYLVSWQGKVRRDIALLPHRLEMLTPFPAPNLSWCFLGRARGHFRRSMWAIFQIASGSRWRFRFRSHWTCDLSINLSCKICFVAVSSTLGYHHFNIDHDLHQDRCLFSKLRIATIVAIISPICACRDLIYINISFFKNIR